MVFVAIEIQRGYPFARTQGLYERSSDILCSCLLLDTQEGTLTTSAEENSVINTVSK